MVLNVLGTSAYSPSYGVFSGPCSALTSTMPCSQNLTYSLSAGDPGKHSLVTGLTFGSTYYIQVQGNNTLYNSEFCISIADMASNSVAPIRATSIGTCGVTYNGTTNGGYYASSTANMDADAPNEVTFVINNVSWFKFCPSAASTYSVTFDVSSCIFSGLNSGSQMAILTGTVGATQATTTLTPIWQAPNPTYASDAPVSSPTFNVASGACVYMLVDGFAGDACSYSYVVNPVGATCLLLPIELMSFNAIAGKSVVDLSWATASEKNNHFFTVERSKDGIYFEQVKRINGQGDSYTIKNYYVVDSKPFLGISYYRLKQTDFDGTSTYSEIKTVEFSKTDRFEVNVYPNPIYNQAELNVSLISNKDDVVDIVIMNSTGM